MAVIRRRKVPESIYMVVSNRAHGGWETYLYHSYQHAWNLKEKLDGRLFKIDTTSMTEILT